MDSKPFYCLTKYKFDRMWMIFSFLISSRKSIFLVWIMKNEKFNCNWLDYMYSWSRTIHIINKCEANMSNQAQNISYLALLFIPKNIYNILLVIYIIYIYSNNCIFRKNDNAHMNFMWLSSWIFANSTVTSTDWLL